MPGAPGCPSLTERWPSALKQGAAAHSWSREIPRRQYLLHPPADCDLFWGRVIARRSCRGARDHSEPHEEEVSSERPHPDIEDSACADHWP
jgi:hypothetical protein